jgi:2-polyprenyl-6-methoxyphenol hydroxylase-like FAD-dependent oxidoreductase
VREVGDVLITGAGPAGLLSTPGLGRADLKVVIEADADLSETPHRCRTRSPTRLRGRST